MKSLSVITTHFHDFGWVDLFVRRLLETTPPQQLLEILVIDQDRTEASRHHLQKLDSKVRVIQYPKSVRHFQSFGYDHPEVLNRAVREAKGTHIAIFDSDAHPFAQGWLKKCLELLCAYDAVLATGPIPEFQHFSHPCFMFLKAQHANLGLQFDQGMFDDGKDCGWLIGEQLRQADQRVLLVRPARGFDGKWGSIYLDCVYHHGQGSFSGGGEKLRSQLTWRHRVFRNAVLEDGLYHLSFRRRLDYEASRFWSKVVKFTTRPLGQKIEKIGRAWNRMVKPIPKE
ncbi:MAG: glycosyltransferase [Verrucomicrobia bacterium]|nr:glycosyltransferase [Verrucomicrobiota bacterium]